MNQAADCSASVTIIQQAFLAPKSNIIMRQRTMPTNDLMDRSHKIFDIQIQLLEIANPLIDKGVCVCVDGIILRGWE